MTNETSKHTSLLRVTALVLAAGVLLPASPALSQGAPFLVKEIRSGTSGSDPFQLVRSGGFVFFRAEDGSLDQLWRTDGTTGGTIKLSSTASCLDHLVDVNGTVFFSAYDDGCSENGELWKSDGTAGGTAMVKDINTTGNFDFMGNMNRVQ
jgi:ELWxxDGT repeat protein